jgi:hypothetical protein|tara:strand:- start:1168 stop:1428 length:261 start_codon:yes stop_codon:yes gene_type:complete
MKVSVYDTYVPKDGNVKMHFDILVEEGVTLKEVYKYGEKYLDSKGLKGLELTTSECQFCHIETAPQNIQDEIKKSGYSIIEMENCN